MTCNAIRTCLLCLLPPRSTARPPTPSPAHLSCRPHFAEVLVELQQQLSAVKAARHAALLPSDTAMEPGQR